MRVKAPFMRYHHPYFRAFGLCLVLFLLANCTKSTSNFADYPVNINETPVFLSPSDVFFEPTTAKLYVLNSNNRLLYNQGAISVFAVSNENPVNPQLELEQALTTPNFASKFLFLSDSNRFIIPFREESPQNDQFDQLLSFDLNEEGLLAQDIQALGCINPYGISEYQAEVWVVCDRSVAVYDQNLALKQTIDLAPLAASYSDANNAFIEDIAIDTDLGLAFISNPLGKIFIIDTTTYEVKYLLNQPLNSRGIAVSNGRLYVIDGSFPALWVYEIANLPEAGESITLIDDSSLLIGQVDLGKNPTRILIDETNERIYITNSGDPSLSVIDSRFLTSLERISFLNEDTGLGTMEQPFGLSLGTLNETTYLFVTFFQSDLIAIIDTTTLKILKRIPE